MSPAPPRGLGPGDGGSSGSGGGPPDVPPHGPCRPTHQELMSLLGAWALSACPPEEARCLEAHLSDCAPCADEALRLRDAAARLTPRRGLDLDPRLRPRVLDSCLARRPASHPVPAWAAPYDAEAARLDALLTDITADEWRAPVRLRWFAGKTWEEHGTTVAGVLDHLMAVDGLLARAVGLPDPLGEGASRDPAARTRARWESGGSERDARDGGTDGGGSSDGTPGHGPGRAWRPWREQSRALVRAAARTSGRAGERMVRPGTYGGAAGPFPGPGADAGGALALSDAYLDRAFACWVHGADIAEAVSYPYGRPLGPHLRLLVDFTAQRLPASLADRRRAGLGTLPARLTTAGRPGRTVHLEVEGAGGGDWYIPLDSPAATVSRAAARRAVAHVALDDVVLCQLAAGRIAPDEAASGAEGDPHAVHDVLFAAADLSRL